MNTELAYNQRPNGTLLGGPSLVPCTALCQGAVILATRPGVPVGHLGLRERCPFRAPEGGPIIGDLRPDRLLRARLFRLARWLSPDYTTPVGLEFVCSRRRRGSANARLSLHNPGGVDVLDVCVPGVGAGAPTPGYRCTTPLGLRNS